MDDTTFIIHDGVAGSFQAYDRNTLEARLTELQVDKSTYPNQRNAIDAAEAKTDQDIAGIESCIQALP